MSSQSQSYSSYSSTSYSSSSSTSTGSDGKTQSHSQSQTMSSNPQDGTTYERVTSESGKPTYVETTHIPAGSSVTSGGGSGRSLESSGGGQQGKIEEISEEDADRLYRERMEDEYAKREGGA